MRSCGTIWFLSILAFSPTLKNRICKEMMNKSSQYNFILFYFFNEIIIIFSFLTGRKWGNQLLRNKACPISILYYLPIGWQGKWLGMYIPMSLLQTMKEITSPPDHKSFVGRWRRGGSIFDLVPQEEFFQCQISSRLVGTPGDVSACGAWPRFSL